MKMKTYKVKFLPHEMEISVPDGDTIIRAALEAGVHVNASCGGEGVCGKCRVIIEDGTIDYPYITPGELDYFIVMSKEAYEKFVPYANKAGTIFYDEDLVDIDEKAPDKRFAIPATRIAEKLGVKIAANIVMLGFFSGNTDVIDVEAVKRAVLESVPARFRKINETAFLEGYNCGKTS